MATIAELCNSISTTVNTNTGAGTDTSDTAQIMWHRPSDMNGENAAIVEHLVIANSVRTSLSLEQFVVEKTGLANTTAVSTSNILPIMAAVSSYYMGDVTRLIETDSRSILKKTSASRCPTTLSKKITATEVTAMMAFIADEILEATEQMTTNNTRRWTTTLTSSCCSSSCSSSCSCSCSSSSSSCSSCSSSWFVAFYSLS